MFQSLPGADELKVSVSSTAVTSLLNLDVFLFAAYVKNLEEELRNYKSKCRQLEQMGSDKAAMLEPSSAEVLKQTGAGDNMVLRNHIESLNNLIGEWCIIILLGMGNRDCHLCSLCLVVKSGTINLFPGRGTKPACKQCDICDIREKSQFWK